MLNGQRSSLFLIPSSSVSSFSGRDDELLELEELDEDEELDELEELEPTQPPSLIALSIEITATAS